MCDFHLNGKCFHPEKVKEGMIADKCEFATCKHCTNKKWQQEQIQSLNEYHKEMIQIINKELPTFQITTNSINKFSSFTKIFS